MRLHHRPLRAPVLVLLWVLCSVPGLSARGEEDPSAPGAAENATPSEGADEEEPEDAEEEEDRAEGEEEEDLRELLTEREDKRRPEDPFSIDVFGRPLTLGGQYEIVLFPFEQIQFGEPPADAGRLLLEQEIELEAFYSFGRWLSLFVQGRLFHAEDLDPDTPDGVSNLFVERGEMWLYSEGVLLDGLSFELGRLNFEDDRRWWWDADLDSIRVGYETDRFEAVFAAASEIAATTSQLRFIDPEDDDVLRFLGELSWDWRPDHSVELFVVHEDDNSGTRPLGSFVSPEHEDESDANLTWIGPRLMGAWGSPGRGLFGYWLDAGYVWGDETLVELEDGVIEGTRRRDVSGWGLDAGLTWVLPKPFEPRFTLAYAYGSGDSKPERGTDRAYRQTRIQGNESGFGGVRSFPYYGLLLNPELSNLHILTLDAGISLCEASSLDLVYHYYRQVEPTEFLAESNLDATLTGDSRDLGHALDLVLAVQELSWLEVDLVGSALRTGDAFGPDANQWTFSGVIGLTFVF